MTSKAKQNIRGKQVGNEGKLGGGKKKGCLEASKEGRCQSDRLGEKEGLRGWGREAKGGLVREGASVGGKGMGITVWNRS